MSSIFVLIIALNLPLPKKDFHFWLMQSEMIKAAAAMNATDTLYPIDALHYDIHLQPVSDSEIVAWTHGIYEVVNPVDTLSIHFRGFTIDSLLLNGGSASYFRTDTTIEIISPSPLSPGDTVDVDVWYHGVPPRSSSGFRGGLRMRRSRIFVAFDLDGARSWFPCHDVPDDKVTVDQFITVPDDYFVVANGNLISADTTGDSITFHWRESYPIATYLIVFAAANNFAHIVDTAHVEGHDIPVHGWVARWDSVQRSAKLQHVAEMLEFYSRVYTPYPFIDEKYANVDVPLGYAMENQTNTFIDFNLHWSNDAQYVIAHELSHQWWGDCVTLATWPDVWLNEGFATYSEAMNAYRTDSIQGYRNYMRRIMSTYINNEPYPPYPIYYPDANIHQLYSVVTYQKAASVLHMLRYVVGDSAFFAILRGRIERHAYGNETTEEFHQLCEDVSGMDLDWFFDEWIYSPGHPTYQWSYSVQPQGDSAFVTVGIHQVQSHAHGVPTFKMPIQFGFVMPSGDTIIRTFMDSLDFQQFSVSLPAYPQEVIFDPYSWILSTHWFTGIKEEERDFNRESVFIPQNVVSDELKLRLSASESASESLNITISDVSGRVVKRVTVQSAGKMSISIDMKDLRNGLYLMQLASPDGRILEKRKIIVFR